jgi:hypothetical protein
MHSLYVFLLPFTYLVYTRVRGDFVAYCAGSLVEIEGSDSVGRDILGFSEEFVVHGVVLPLGFKSEGAVWHMCTGLSRQKGKAAPWSNRTALRRRIKWNSFTTLLYKL